MVDYDSRLRPHELKRLIQDREPLTVQDQHRLLITMLDMLERVERVEEALKIRPRGGVESNREVRPGEDNRNYPRVQKGF